MKRLDNNSMDNNLLNIKQLKTAPIAKAEAMVIGSNYRVTVLTSRLIRLEYNEDGIFEDRATQTVINRDFDVPEFRVTEGEDLLEVDTKHLHLIYDKKRFHGNGLSIQVKGNISAYRSIWHFGETFENLKGTYRTLDEANGAIPLEDGLLSRNGFSVLDDSHSILLMEDGWVQARDKSSMDFYFLGYGRDYLGCLKDFFKLSGPSPMLPRYALGNWWSRFYPYSEGDYKQLMNQFKAERVPFSVAVIDMDWHLTRIDPKYGSGWTGYTWNLELFPNPENFLQWLHKEGLHVTLNVHPADGVRAHEEAYLNMAKVLGVDYEKEDKITFDSTSTEFLKAYFKYLHHPHEDIGVDFWWLDWQQGGYYELDPLWILNHYHYLDNGRNGKRPMTFSRYAGIGSHRYPVGFSGDSIATWESLDFQPYFTATASNVGYGWWSHDIGGHMHGSKDDEMAARWVAFGIFSPIMRIHSSDNPFNEKEPWKYNLMAEKAMTRLLNLRHQLVPYLYTMNYRFYKEGIPLIQPMYYQYAETQAAYEVPNQYFFGSELIACPITKPGSKTINMGWVKVFIPEGRYYDFFTGRIYKGNRMLELYRDIQTIPVLAKAGSIIPLTAKSGIKNELNNPTQLEVRIFAGESGSFTLYEDNSTDTPENEVKSGTTTFHLKSEDNIEIILEHFKGEDNIIPEIRNYLIKIFGVTDSKDISINNQGTAILFKQEYDHKQNCLVLEFKQIDTSKDTKIILRGSMLAFNSVNDQVFDMLNLAQMEFDLKNAIFSLIKDQKDKGILLGSLQAMNLEHDLYGALIEIITAL